MFKKTALLLLASSAFASASAQTVTDIQANQGQSAYLQDGRGVIVRSQSGLCWRTGYWAPADAVTGCDGALVPPIAKPTAPPIVPPAAPATAQATPAVRACDFSVTLESDQTFAFNKAVLSAAARKRIDADVLPKLSACSKIEVIQVTGHTDPLGSQLYNKRLSEKRAEAVAGYLRAKGLASRIDTAGAGETQPVATCPAKLPRTKLIECLAPDRRVVIEVRGTAK